MNNEYTEAEELLVKHHDIFPESRYAPNVLFILGEVNFKKEEYYKAIGYWQKLNQNYPDSDYALYGIIRIGDAYFQLKRYDSAVRTYRQVKKHKLSDVLTQELGLKINECLYYLGKYPSLIEALQNFIDTYTDTTKSGGIVAKTMLRMARIYITKKEYYTAREILQRLIDTYPQSPIISEALFEQANAYKLIGDIQGYKRALQLVVSRKDTMNIYPYAIIELANLYRSERSYDSSLQYWIKLKELGNYQDRALKEIAKTYYSIGFFDEALIILESLIKDFPESRFIIDAYLLRVEILKKKGDLLKAKDVLNDLLSKDTQQPLALLELGNIYFELKDYSLALRCYLQASESFKDQRDESGKALIKAGDVALVMGDTTNARRYYLNARLIAISEEVKNLLIIKMNQIR